MELDRQQRTRCALEEMLWAADGRECGADDAGRAKNARGGATCWPSSPGTANGCASASVNESASASIGVSCASANSNASANASGRRGCSDACRSTRPSECSCRSELPARGT